MPMQPRPIAETSSPCPPSLRLPKVMGSPSFDPAALAPGEARIQGFETAASQVKSPISNISRISITEGPGIGLGQRLAHSIASSRSLTLQIQ